MSFLGVYRAVYDYAAQTDEEIETKEGDLLFQLERDEGDGWLKCKKKAASEEEDEPEGLVPSNYVEQAKPEYSAKALYDYTKQTDEELSFQEGSRLDVFDTSDADWTLVGANGEYGFAPAIYIESGIAASSESRQTVAPAAPPMPARPIPEDEPIPGEADYAAPSSSAAASTPAAALAGILAQRTGGAHIDEPSQPPRALAPPPALASPPLPNRAQYTPEESEEEQEPSAPSLPQRPPSQTISSPPPATQKRVLSPRYEDNDYPEPMRSPGGYHLYNIHESITHMGKSKKLPMTLGINVAKGIIMISPEKSRDGPTQEWTAEKLTHYSIEGKHVFVELVRPSKSIDFHAGAKDTANEIVAHLGELAGAVRAEGLREVLAASEGTGAGGKKTGVMRFEFMAQGDDEVTVAEGDEVLVVDDKKSEEWWMVRRLKNGKEGVVPSSYVEVTGTVAAGPDSITGLNAARSTIEQNRLEEERLAREAARKTSANLDVDLPERGSSLAGESSRSRSSRGDKRGPKEGASSSSASKSKPNKERVRQWTDRSGTFRVDAEFIGLREGKIHLHKLNGVKIAVPVSKMAVEDLEYVEQVTGASLDEDKPLSDIKRRNTQKAKANGTQAGATIENAKDHEYWFDFFLSCNVNPQICERYASAFSKDQMTPDILPQVNEPLLRTLGLKEGDILRVMKFLDNKYDRNRGGDDDKFDPANGGLFAGPGGALKNNTRKGRPAPTVQTNDVVSEDAFKQDEVTPAAKSPPIDAKATPLTSAPSRTPTAGFDDDAWDVKPARTITPEVARAVEPPRVASPVKPLINDDIASLSIATPPLQPTPAPLPASRAPTAQAQTPSPAAQPSQPPAADQALFDKIAMLGQGRQRPQPPPQQPAGGVLGMPPPPRAASAPGFQQPQNTFGPMQPLQTQLTGYNPQAPQQNFQQPQHFPTLQPQQTAFQNGYLSQGLQTQQQFNGFPQPQQTGIQSIQQNYPPLQPQPTGLNFQPQSQFGQQQQSQQYGIPPPQQPQPSYAQQYLNGTQTGSPFADPPRQPYQPSQPSGLANSFTAQQTGFAQPQQSFYNPAQPAGLNGFQAQPPPQLPPQQTGGVFGPSQPIQPLVPQQTGPPPPVRFGVLPGANKLAPQPTGRANLAKATPQNPFGF